MLTFIVVITNPSAAPATKARKPKKRAGNDGDETEGERTNDEGQEAGLPRRRSSRVTRSHPGEDVSTGDEGMPVTPKPKRKPRPRPITKQKTPEGVAVEEQLPPDSPKDADSPSGQIGQIESQPPSASDPPTARKRPRSPERTDEIINGVDSTPGSPEEPEIQVRRKRIRH